jgi:hypothetical protein
MENKENSCVPTWEGEEIAEALVDQNGVVRIDVTSNIFGKVVGNSFVLSVGWGVQSLS